jgi:hypothetical protein
VAVCDTDVALNVGGIELIIVAFIGRFLMTGRGGSSDCIGRNTTDVSVEVIVSSSSIAGLDPPSIRPADFVVAEADDEGGNKDEKCGCC